MDHENLFDNRKSDVIEIDLVELFGVLISKIWFIILSAIIVALATFGVTSYLITPKYESTTKIYVINRQSNDTLTYSDLQSGAQLTKDYQELIKARPVLEEVNAELGLTYTNKEYDKMITVSVPTDTRIVSMTVKNEDPYLARAIADSLRISASKHIANVMNTEAVNIVEEANLPTEISNPKILMDTVIGGVLGAFIAIFITLVIYIMDDTIKNPDDVEKYLHINVLGSIPYAYATGTTVSKKKKKSGKPKHAHTVKVNDVSSNQRHKGAK